MRKTKKKHTVRTAVLIVLGALIVGGILFELISGYVSSLPKYSYTYSDKTAQNMVSYPDTSFAVMSDLHYYDTSLGTSGSAFEACLDSDRKLIKESANLISLSVDDILKTGVKFVMVSGDLTKDGELIDHQGVAKQLQRLVDAGIKVYVVPGNHDVSNPGAVSYDGDTTTPVQNVSSSEFASIYQNCGYGDAVLRDSDSLSYVAEPQDGLWVVALDSCEYEKNKAGVEETVAGELTQPQITWLQSVLQQANEKGKAVIVLEHHGIVEHWKGQSKLHPDYLLSDYKYVGKLLSSYDVRLAFTGHYHAQDITEENNGDSGFIYDIETGSLITAPCAMRYCTISKNSLTVKTQTIVDDLYPGTTFAADATAFVKKTIYNEAYKTLKGYRVSDSGADYIANAVCDAFNAHYNGDEDESKRVAVDEGKLNLWDRFIYSQEKYVLDGSWQDLPPTDNNCTIDLSAAS